MFKDIKSIQIAGGCYDDGTTLEDILSQRMNIVYGRNGSGKSSLAKAIYDYAHNNQTPKFDISFLPELSDDAKARMFVYSEDFVIDNVKLQKEGLDQIVMIGEQVGLSNQEDILKQTLTDTDQELASENDKLAGTIDLRNKAADEIEKALKGEYAEREKNFKQMGRKPTVPVDAVRAEILRNSNLYSTFDITQLIKDIEDGTRVMQRTKGVSKVYWSAPVCNMPAAFQSCSKLLEKKVHQVELDERDRYLMSILSDNTLSHYVDDAKKDIINANAEICPLCQQSLSSAKREDLEAQIKRVLNKDAEDYKTELYNAIAHLNSLEIILSAPPFTVDTYSADIAAFNDVVDKINATINDVCNKLKAKTNDLFNSAEPLDLSEINQCYANYEKVCQKLQEDVAEFNKNIDDRNKLENDLKQKNQVLIYLENKVLFDGYAKAEGVISSTTNNITTLENHKKGIQRQLKDIESQRSQTKIAIDFINHCLCSVFFERDRLVLEQADGKFVLKSRGKSVAPDSVSTGERNIIGLAYFFASLYENTSESGRFNLPYLVVIDDPITSFDQDNRLGVTAFLKETLTDLLVNSDDSKVVIMSHDQRTIDLLVNINRSVENSLNRKNGQNGHDDYYIYELHRRARRQVNSNTKNEYSQMLNLLYRFAQEEDPDKIEYVGIGNTIRRVLETFSLMVFNVVDYVRVVDNPNLRLYTPSQCDRDKLRRSYRRMLTRIVLNPESHSSMQIDQDSYESTFTRESLQVLAQYTLTFIMCVNDQHLWSSLEKGWKAVVLAWLNNQIEEDF